MLGGWLGSIVVTLRCEEVLRKQFMSAIEVLQAVQYVTVKGKRFAVLTLSDWESLVEWLETLEDVQLARDALAELRASGGDREKAGWLRWDDVKEQLE